MGQVELLLTIISIFINLPPVVQRGDSFIQWMKCIATNTLRPEADISGMFQNLLFQAMNLSLNKLNLYTTLQDKFTIIHFILNKLSQVFIPSAKCL